MPKTRAVSVALSPMCSAHNGSSEVRAPRAAAMASTPVPRVNRVRRCSTSTDPTERRGAVAAARSCPAVRSGRSSTRRNAPMLVDDGHGIRTPDVPPRHHRRAHERPEEQADAVHATQGRERPRTHGHRHHLGEVGLPCQVEQRPRQAHREDGHAEHPHLVGEQGAGHRDRVDHPGHHERPPLADPGGEGPRGQRGGELSDAEQRHREGGDADRGAQLARAEREHRQHRAVAERGQHGRAVGRERDAAQQEGLGLRRCRGLGHSAHCVALASAA